MTNNIDWSILINWLASGLINLVYAVFGGLIGGWFVHYLERKRDDLRWHRERDMLAQQWEHDKAVLDEQWQHQRQVMELEYQNRLHEIQLQDTNRRSQDEFDRLRKKYSSQ